MFSTFARRLTTWYVAVAVALVAIVLTAGSIVGLYLFINLLQSNIEADAREAQAYAARAEARRQPFAAAAIDFERRMTRPGVRIAATGPFGVPPGARRNREFSAPLVINLMPRRNVGPPPLRFRRGPPPPPTYINGVVVPGDPRSIAFEGNRFGFALGTAFGSKLVRVDFVGGDLRLLPDPDTVGRVAESMLAAIVTLSALAGFLAWFTGRYITTQVLSPLIEVTHALQRFAARDFRPQPIAVAGKSEFDAIALAYNAASAQVAAAFAESAQAEIQMRQFVADAGHELRTPLTIVLGYIDLLRRKVDAGDERSRKIFASINAEGARMSTLIDNLVLLARMEGEDVRPVDPFPLLPLLDEVVDARRVLVPGLRVDVDAAVEATVLGNRGEIYEAVANIIDNAIKYAPGAAIRITLERAPGGVELRIADDGPGIHPEDRSAIFDRFFRGTTRGDVEGSGLGLAIAKRAVERAGGTLSLVEGTKRGTTFAIQLRADQAEVRSRGARVSTT